MRCNVCGVRCALLYVRCTVYYVRFTVCAVQCAVCYLSWYVYSPYNILPSMVKLVSRLNFMVKIDITTGGHIFSIAHILYSLLSYMYVYINIYIYELRKKYNISTRNTKK